SLTTRFRSSLFPYTTLFRSPAREISLDDPLHQFISVLLLRALNRMMDEMASAREIEGIDTNESRMLNVACTYPTGTLHDLLPFRDRKSTRLNSSHKIISYAI